MSKKPPPLTPRELVALRLAAPPSRGLFHRAVQACDGLHGLLNASVSRLTSIPRVDENRARAIAGALENAEAIDRELDLIDQLDARIVGIDGPDYPPALLETPVPPPIIYLRGPAGLHDRAAVGIVGARSSTQYGQTIARALGRGMARAGITVVSGFAQGVDQEAMSAAVEAGGRVFGALAYGLTNVYPASARKLTQQVLEDGALISEYPMETKPHNAYFPERNSIIAGLSLGTVVVEAAEKSGSLITAECALEAGRSVFAVPGDITRENSRGANRLIQAGAKLVMDANDILRELAPRLKDALRERDKRALRAGAGSDVPTPPSADSPADPDLPTGKKIPADLTPLERALLERITHEEQAVDVLMTDAELAPNGPSGLSMALLQLEMRGLIRKSGGGLYTRVF